MTPELFIMETLLGFMIGLALGLLGGGGSILTVPALVYLVGQSPQVAVTASLMIVGTNSTVGALFHRSQGTLNWRVALTFGGAGMITAYFAAGLSDLFSPTVLMLLFALLMLIVGTYMIFRKPPTEDQQINRGLGVTLLAGASVGVLTGFLGVGGGFLIVPALVMLVGLPIPQAIGTSLVIIAMNSFAGVLGHMSNLSIDYATIVVFAASGIAGAFIGARMTHRIEPVLLRRMFATFVIVLGLLLMMDNVSQLVG